MRLRDCAPAIVALTLALLSGCAKEDGSRIIGHWRAERFELMGLKLPLGPELEITRTMLAAGETGIQVPLTGLSEEDDEVTLETEANIGLSFHFVEADRMYVEIPLVDRIYYRRVMAEVASGARAPGAAAEPEPVVVAAITRQPPVAEPALSNAPAPWSAAYEAALSAARNGDDDAAVRQLYQAYHEGWRDRVLAVAAPEFARLQTDVRFQVLLGRLEGP